MTHPFILLAGAWVGTREESSNHFDGMQKVWADTSYPNGYRDRQPYCAAFVCHIVAEAKRHGANIAALPTSPSVRELRSWATARGYIVKEPQPGDIATGLPAGLSHVGFVESVHGATINTIEGNTNNKGTRDGDGIWRKQRKTAKCDFFRIPIQPT